MANPEELRKYPQSRVTQVLYVMLALVIIAALVGSLF